MINIQRIGCFCGSSIGAKPKYRDAVRALGKEMSKRKMDLIFGGASIGLMRVIADEILHGDRVAIGVMPHFLTKKEIVHPDATEFIIVDGMNERKQKMIEMSDAFIAMPGGFGTLDEISEVLTGFQLNIIKKPLALYNVDHYFEHFLLFLDKMVEEQFLIAEHRNNIIVESDPEKLLDALRNFIPIEIPHRWVDELKEKTGKFLHFTKEED